MESTKPMKTSVHRSALVAVIGVILLIGVAGYAVYITSSPSAGFSQSSSNSSSLSTSGQSSSTVGGGSTSSTSAATSTSTPFPPVATITVVTLPSNVGNDRSLNYQPPTITVVIGVNNTIIWTDKDTVSMHTVTSTSVPNGASPFDSGNLISGQNYVLSLTVPGTYQYHCKYDSWMSGTILVLGPTTTTTTTTVPRA